MIELILITCTAACTGELLLGVVLHPHCAAGAREEPPCAARFT